MKITKRLLAYILTFAVLVSVFPASVFAAENDEFRISNKYLSFSFNDKTGGFAIETAEGNPQKSLDDDIPLLYADDRQHSNGTSFITVRIDKKDYVFGQNYGFLSNSLGEVTVTEEGRLMTVPWTVDDVTVTLKAALSADTNSSTTGNIGIAFEVYNNSDKEKDVSVRLLLDTALGNDVDAPYFVVDAKKTATIAETKFSDTDPEAENVPGQIRAVDSLTNPKKLAYMLLQGWNSGTVPNKVILGHWANLANTKYDYEPDKYCDFTNYSNDYREPDSAAALYWEGNKVAPGEEGKFSGEVLYGVGNFSDTTLDYPIGINMTVYDRVEVEDGKKAYTNDGKIKVSVEIDNAVDNSTELSNVYVNIVTDETKIKVAEDDSQTNFISLGKDESKLLNFTVAALPQNDLCAGTIYVQVTGTKVNSDGSFEDFEAAAQRSVILPSVGNVTEIQMNKVTPETVYTEGEKAVTVSGKMSALKAMLSDQTKDKVKLKLIHTKTKAAVTIENSRIAFLDETYETMTFTTEEELTVGEYDIAVEIDDDELVKELGYDKVYSDQRLEVSADSKYRIKSYGMAALVRITESSGKTYYDFYTFDTEKEYMKFKNGTASAKGEYSDRKIEYGFESSKEAIVSYEIILTVRAKLKEMYDESGGKFWQADHSDGDIVINNMLSYEGDTPLKVRRDGKEYTVEGDGLLKVINSINVWRSKWNITAEEGTIFTLDTERFSEAAGKNVPYEELTLKFGGAASMIQTLGGFAVDLKYGVLSSSWEGSPDGKTTYGVTYGIGFGGKISLPIKAKSGSDDEGEDSGSQGGTGSGTGDFNVTTGYAYEDAEDITNRESDLRECLTRSFGEELAEQYISGEITEELRQSGIDGGGTGSGTGLSSSTVSSSPATTSSTGDKVKKNDDSLPKGKLSAEVDNVLFGEKSETTGEGKDKKVVVTDTGFIGIDATFSLSLPKNVLGSFIANAPGLSASVTINTIDNEYEINAGLQMKIIECEGVLAFKQVSVKNKDTIVPDKIEFYIRDGLKLPIAAPVLYMTGLGGGINGLADTIGGEFDELPPITVLLYTKLEALEMLEGEFNAEISLEGLSLEGELGLSEESLEKLLHIDAGINARWIEPWELSLYGNVNIIDGLIKGGITVTIADNYFYGYVFATLCIPDSIPLVGGKALRGVEAAVSHEFIGANVTIIGIKFGVKYYWGENVTFGGNIDLSPPPKNTQAASFAIDERPDGGAIGYYGTNVTALETMLLAEPMSLTNYNEVTVNVEDADGKTAILIEIPYTGIDLTKDDIELYNPDGTLITLTPDDGEGGGNMLIQNRDGEKYIYVTVTDSDDIMSGKWKVRYDKNSKFEITDFSMNSVSDIPEMDERGTSILVAETNNKETTVKVAWNIKGDTDGKVGTIDVYLTENENVLTDIKTSQNSGSTLGTSIYHEENVDLGTAAKEALIKLPDALASGKYYAVTVLSLDGISLAISPTAISFVNPNLPKPVDKAELYYGGNGELFVKVTDADEADYTHYLAEIVADDGTTLQNNVGQFEKGKGFTFGKDALLEEGKSYHVEIKTLREEYKNTDGEYKTHYYYGTDKKKSNSVTMPEIKLPKLIGVNVNFDTSGDDINTNVKDVIIEYTFENDVFVEMDLNGSKVYAFGVDPDPNAYSTYFRKNWKFVLDGLEDGDYVVDFAAYTDKKDHIKGSETVGVPNSSFGFTVDTSAPVLSLAQNSAASIAEGSLVFGANTVVADENGKYTIAGLTEKAAVLKIDGETVTENTAGATVSSNGSFEIEKTFGEGENAASHVITAVDKAGNASKITVWAVRQGGFAFDGVEIFLDGKEITPDENNEKVITIKNGQSAELSVYLKSGKNKFKADGGAVDWSVLYERNALSLEDGRITAKSPAETAVKAKLVTANALLGEERFTDGLSDYVVINIEENTKADLEKKIEEAKELLNSNSDASDSKKKALNNAIESAEAVLNKSDATKEECSNAVSELAGAMEKFKKAESGTSFGGHGGSTTPYTVTAEKAEHGKIELSQTKVYHGNSLTVTAVPDEGYTVSDMIINGKSVGNKAVYTLRSVKENVTVKVIFREKTKLPFTDVPEDAWFRPYVETAFKNGYLKGVTETEFAPEARFTRAMFVTVLHRMSEEAEEGENPFSDVSDDAYYKNAVAWAYKNGIVAGLSETVFGPEDVITREQMAVMLLRYAEFKGYDVSVGENTNILSYEDFDEIHEYAIAAMQYAVGSGLIVGKTEKTLAPLEKSTRAEAATIFVRFAEMTK